MGATTKDGTIRCFLPQSKCPFLAVCFYILTFFSVEAFYSNVAWNSVALSSPRVSVVRSNHPSASSKARGPKRSRDSRWKGSSLGAIAIPAADSKVTVGQPFLPPWDTSMIEGEDAFYTQFMNQFLDSISEKLQDVQHAPIPPHLMYKEAVNGKKGRISTYAFQSKEFKKIRTTSVDCGSAFQVFNVLFEPHANSDMPMFGAEFLTIGERHLVVVDLLPMFEDDEYTEKYIAPMDAVKAANPHLIGQLSGKHYDEAKFFSRNMLFARKVGEERVPEASVAPAFKEYLDYYLDLAASAPTPANAPAAVAARHAEFHAYSHAKNPAKAVFNMWFGQEWGQDFSKFIHQP